MRLKVCTSIRKLSVFSTLQESLYCYLTFSGPVIYYQRFGAGYGDNNYAVLGNSLWPCYRSDDSLTPGTKQQVTSNEPTNATLFEPSRGTALACGSLSGVSITVRQSSFSEPDKLAGLQYRVHSDRIKVAPKTTVVNKLILGAAKVQFFVFVSCRHVFAHW